jgi:hypothetical protein
MPKATETSEFTVKQVWGVLSNIPTYKNDAFMKDKELIEFVTGVTCPLTEEPADGDMEGQEAYLFWIAWVIDYTHDFLGEQFIQQCPGGDMLKDLEGFVPEQLNRVSIFKAVDKLLSQVDDMGIDLDYIIVIQRLPQAARKKAARTFADPAYRAKRLNELLPDFKDALKELESAF